MAQGIIFKKQLKGQQREFLVISYGLLQVLASDVYYTFWHMHGAL